MKRQNEDWDLVLRIMLERSKIIKRVPALVRARALARARASLTVKPGITLLALPRTRAGSRG